MKHLGGREVSTLDLGSQGFRFECRWMWNSAHDCIVLLCTVTFIVALPLSQYDLSNVERDLKHLIIINISIMIEFRIRTVN